MVENQRDFKGSWPLIKVAGLATIQRDVGELMPEVADRTTLLADWKQITPLSAESSRLPIIQRVNAYILAFGWWRPKLKP